MLLQKKLINYSYFVAFNILLANIIAIGYLFNESINNWYFFTEIQHKNSAYVFYIFNHIWRISLIPLIVGLFSIPIIFLPNKTRYIIQALIACLGIAILIYDVRVFYSCKVHITESYTQHFLNSNIFTIGRLIYALCLFFLFLVEIYIAYWLDKVKLFIKPKILSVFSMLLFISVIISSIIFSFGLTKDEQKLITANRYWPLLFNKDEYLVLTDIDRKNFYFSRKAGLGELNYPINKLKTTVVSSPPNIVIIGIDAWRADYFNAIDTPNLWQFAQKGIILHNHKSGANHTKLGLFSLFYALPPTYSYNFSEKQLSPVFIERLLQLDYQLMFSFAGLGSFKGNGFDKTIFNKISNKHFIASGETPADWDESITKSWLNWYDKRNTNKPYFSFLFYFSPHENDFPEDLNKNYTPTKGKYRHKDFITTVGKQGFIGAYKTSVQYVDSLIAKVIQKLKDTDDLTNTIIIITSDHGREFDDNHQGCWTNGSNFTDCQIKVPCAIIGPNFSDLQSCWGKQDLTTHYDIIPTIMKNFLGVQNDISDYSIGVDLFNTKNKRNWLFTTNSLRHSMPCAIVDENTIFQWFPSGFYQFFNKQNHHVFTEVINKQRLTEVFDMMTRFLK